MFTQDQIKQINDLIQKVFDANYKHGATRIPPHKHTGVDNLQLDASDILNLPASSPPGGIDTEVQFNDNGSFGGDTGLIYDKNKTILGVHDINNILPAPNNGFDLSITAQQGARLVLTTNNIDTTPFANPAGPTGNIVLASDDIDSFDTGSVTINSGNNTTTGNSGDVFFASGGAAGNVGNLTIQTGSGNTNGDITIQTSGITNTSHGNISISAGGNANSKIDIVSANLAQLRSSTNQAKLIGQTAATVMSKTSDVNITAGSNAAQTGAVNITGGTAAGNVEITANGSSVIHLNSVTRAASNFGVNAVAGGSFGGGDGVLLITVANTNPSSDPSSGFLIYTDTGDGKLKARGSSGTITTLALP